MSLVQAKKAATKTLGFAGKGLNLANDWTNRATCNNRWPSDGDAG